MVTGQPSDEPQLLFQLDERTWWWEWDVLPDGRGFVMLRAVDDSPFANRLEIVTGWLDELLRRAPTGQ